MQFWFNLYAGYSGQRFFDSWYQSFYNLIFTSIPVLVVGVLDQPVSQVRRTGLCKSASCLEMHQQLGLSQRSQLH